MSKSSGPYHEGELAVQRVAGEREDARNNSPMIADAVMPGARSFLETQQMLVIASRDRRGSLWASIVFGRAGFVSVHEAGHTVTMDLKMVFSSDAEILWANLQPEAPLGILAIELSTRRRLRINGRVTSLTSERLVLRVEESYPNCPKYIQRRLLRSAAPRETTDAAREGHLPDAALLAAIKKSDTIFVASGHPSRGLDASHRGGPPGFIRFLAPDLLHIPDYAGNSMFNTLGNLSIDPRCGLTLLDFQEGRVYQMTGETKLHFNPPPEKHEPAITGRSWDFVIQSWRSVELPIRTDWEFLDYSPYNPS
jgi:predicted pyridoxine 5'-phosphate oxidase superfamily flavin-nucleotide-binding protein